MALTIANATEDAALDAIFDKLDDGAGAGYVDICDDTTVLATLTFSDPACAASSGGIITFNAVTSDMSAAATGTADVCRFYDSDDTLLFTGTVGVTGSGADIELDTTSIATGDIVLISSGTASF